MFNDVSKKDVSTVKTRIRTRILIKGIVQGVGFRPFLYRSAHQFHLTGFVKNTSQGVILEVEGKPEDIEGFIPYIINDPPPLSLIEHHEWMEIPVAQSEVFEIVSSEDTDAGEGELMVSPDIAICGNCARELFTDSDPRYRYPFINCTDCGPRFSIIRDLPYDRPKTTMAVFPMCETCNKEYVDPYDRRYHAQPVSCYKCGPTLSFHSSTIHGSKTGELLTGNPLELAAQKLKEGYVVAIKGLGGYHLACRALQGGNDPVKRLRQLKRREKKPFALMGTLEMIRNHAEVTKKEEQLLGIPAAPILLLKKKPGSTVLPGVAPDQDRIGFMLPYTPLHLLLLDLVKEPLVMTSANISDEPIIYKSNSKALNGLCDYILDNDREIHMFADDSVGQVFEGNLYMVRRSRGYVPMPLKVSLNWPKTILAVGPMLKTTFTLLVNGRALISQYIGDTDSPASIEAEKRAIRHFTDLFLLKPGLVVLDKHPGYPNRELAGEFPEAEVIEIQHHKAHVGSLLAETGETDPILGIAMDGTGYGDDGNIWGGEFFVGNDATMERFCHLNYLFLPSGDLSAKEPWRFALSMLYAIYGPGEKFDTESRKRFCEIYGTKAEMLLEVIKKQVGGILTSSCGRLFDGAASLIGVGDYNDYEGELPMRLQALAERSDQPKGIYSFTLEKQDNHRILNFLPMIRDIIDEQENSQAKNMTRLEQAYRFHNTLAEGFFRVAEVCRQERGIDKVGLTGGVFQNTLLLKLTKDRLEAAGFTVLIHSKVPPNDGGISLGQAYLAACPKGS